jgi:hypothetical protein
MISHKQFGTMRLAQFLQDHEIAELKHWEFMDQLWIGEAVGFSEWLRLEDEPEVLRSLAIDFSRFPKQAAAEVLRTIGLPVQRGMELVDLRRILGDPVKQFRFAKDRVTYDFATPGTPRYDVSCTLLNNGGLTYLVIMARTNDQS